MADAVFITTPDRLHRDPAVACAGLGYQLLVEKPMATTERDALDVVEAAERAGVLLEVCHVLRYTDYTQEIRRIVEQGEIGRIASIEHLEPVGWWHFAHSYVRGNWGNTEDSSPLLLSKSSHDIDWLSYIMGQPARRVSSFGSLMEFNPANKPAGAASRCLDCPVSQACPYSAETIYARFLGHPVFQQWPLGVLTPVPTEETVKQALARGPYGRCVYDGFNDVIDHQVVNIEYEGGATASFTVVAFTDLDFRKTRVFGTRGSINGDGRRLVVHDFLTDTRRKVDFGITSSASAADGHGGADGKLIAAFMDEVRRGTEGPVHSGGRESLYTHSIVWAAERARLSGTVVDLDGIGASAVPAGAPAAS
jgi:predicted dehydrogenase